MQWALMTLLDPVKSIANLVYIGYQGGIASVLRITRRRRLHRKKQQSDRNVFQCFFVFGPKGAGKSSLLNSFVGRPSSDAYSPTTTECFATNTVNHLGGNKKTLILREIPEDGVKRLLSSKESLADCDVAIFVHDSSDEKSWKRATELLVDVATHGEDTGFEVPCLIIVAKDDLDPFPLSIQKSTRMPYLSLSLSLLLSLNFVQDREIICARCHYTIGGT
ncbi:mitochondrial Rho GTPase 1-like isoform X1 [Papaver somniferum]|uniref:mitochondrial Rho GTPase 1-like isoform X1 n=1 Tax=Papaver somniferum TaxID=3469 RepID=UPI000E700A57|nr:mitochondrial Rho GTPase 1-like isoform X1 [Papaver somniferum]XP_026453185.1 mitochondrial Rho GTPase 1-like isoform X1 [Papaver somniferum]XP_026453186.1 mitochondrial Rho GTPase 1-like isoform X1 [Papaver somniferum]